MAFERIARRNISGLAVVNDDGHTLFGNISGSDIKHLGTYFPPPVLSLHSRSLSSFTSIIFFSA